MFYVTIIQFLTVWGVEPVVTHGLKAQVYVVFASTQTFKPVSAQSESFLKLKLLE